MTAVWLPSGMPRGDLAAEAQCVVVGARAHDPVALEVPREHVDGEFDRVRLDDHDLVTAAMSGDGPRVVLEHRTVGPRHGVARGALARVMRRSRAGDHDDDVGVDRLGVKDRLDLGSAYGVGIEQVDPQPEHARLARAAATADELEPLLGVQQPGREDLRADRSSDRARSTDDRDVHGFDGRPACGAVARSRATREHRGARGRSTVTRSPNSLRKPSYPDLIRGRKQRFTQRI